MKINRNDLLIPLCEAICILSETTYADSDIRLKKLEGHAEEWILNLKACENEKDMIKKLKEITKKLYTPEELIKIMGMVGVSPNSTPEINNLISSNKSELLNIIQKEARKNPKKKK